MTLQNGKLCIKYIQDITVTYIVYTYLYFFIRLHIP